MHDEKLIRQCHVNRAKAQNNNLIYIANEGLSVGLRTSTCRMLVASLLSHNPNRMQYNKSISEYEQHTRPRLLQVEQTKP